MNISTISRQERGACLQLQTRGHRVGQRGVVLFLTLIALVIMSLAAMALVRSVDTSTMVAGNLAFKHSATMGADTGVELAIDWIKNVQAANVAKNVLEDATHPFNIDDKASGYYSSYDPTLKLMDDSAANHISWTPGVDCASAGTDSAGNTILYIVQRMCKFPNKMMKESECLYVGEPTKDGTRAVLLPSEVCNGPGCPFDGETPLYAITVKVSGAHSAISYVQNFVN